MQINVLCQLEAFTKANKCAAGWFYWRCHGVRWGSVNTAGLDLTVRDGAPNGFPPTYLSDASWEVCSTKHYAIFYRTPGKKETPKGTIPQLQRRKLNGVINYAINVGKVLRERHK